MNSERTYGKVAAILSSSRFVLNLGSRDGIVKGDRFYIFVDLGPFSDPVTGDSLGGTRDVLGIVTAQIVEEHFCIAETGFVTQAVEIFPLFRTTEVRNNLPVKKSDVMDGDINEIAVGMDVLLDRSLNQEAEATLVQDVENPRLPEESSRKTEQNEEPNK